MPTSSITKNFVVEGDEQVNKFIAAWEAAEEDKRNRPKKQSVSFHEATTDDELRELITISKQNNEKQ